ncbi:MAG: hypothetical protein JRJ20_17225 [Deltaproteobacteria bacterium]|nr:hypothetical protein [Deltaproteobacteria bacterium]
MKNHQPIDPFTYHVLERIDPKVRASLTPAQLSAIKKAIAGSRPLKKNPIDIRGIVPLFFIRYYFVFISGRDKRLYTKRLEKKRRWLTSLSGGLTLFILGVAPLILALVLLLYLMKCVFGINIMSDMHLKDLVMFWK